MRRIIKYLASFLFFGCASNAFGANNIPGQDCHNIISQLTVDTWNTTKPQRTAHLLELITNSPNKYKLINDLYLHYRSIEKTSNELSKSLELCLIGLLKISKEDPALKEAFDRRSPFNILNPPKTEDPVHAFLAERVVNLNFFYPLKSAKLKRLIELDKLEEKPGENVTCDHFDQVISPKPLDPDIIMNLQKAIEDVMNVEYNGHSIFYQNNIDLVYKVINLLKNYLEIKDLQTLLSTYEQKPEEKSFKPIKNRLREFYFALTDMRIAKSLNEYYAELHEVAKKLQKELVEEAKVDQQKFFGENNVQVALLLKANLKLADQELKTTINPSRIQEFNQIYYKIASFAPRGLGLYWDKKDKEEFINLVSSMRDYIKKEDDHVKFLNQAINDFNESKADASRVKEAAKDIFSNVSLLHNTYQSLSQNYEKNKSIFPQIEKMELNAQEVEENIRRNLHQAINNCHFRDLEELKRCARNIIIALGGGDEIKKRINAVFLED